MTEDNNEVVRMLADGVAIKPDPFPEEKAGLIIPDAYAERPEHRFWRGTVTSVGPGQWRYGRRVRLDVEIGDRVLFDRNSSQPIVNGWAAVPEAAILLKGEGVDEFDFVSKHGLRNDGTRV